jgi:polyisoprenoid-binding protein YceI
MIGGVGEKSRASASGRIKRSDFSVKKGEFVAKGGKSDLF